MKIHRYLSLFDYLISHGAKTDGKYKINGLTAWHDLDGYTCFIGYKDLMMTLYFHNKFSIEYEDSKTLKHFEQIVEQHSQN